MCFFVVVYTLGLELLAKEMNHRTAFIQPIMSKQLAINNRNQSSQEMLKCTHEIQIFCIFIHFIPLNGWAEEYLRRLVLV